LARTSATVRFPAEWERQSGVQLTWPNVDADWKGLIDLTEKSLADIAREISLRERVLIVCADPGRVRGFLDGVGANIESIAIHVLPSNDVWARDHGPVTVFEDGRPTILDFGFNGWGLKYPSNFDNQLTRRLSENGAFGGIPVRTMDLILEGGSLESDGEGTLLTTSRCLLSPNRNPALTKKELERRLKRCLGLRRVLWLDHGDIPGDDTDGHIDTLARFCDSRTIAYVGCDDPNDECYGSLKAMERQLRRFKTVEGEPYRLVRLPTASPVCDADGLRLPATYANFLIINGAVLVPTYGVPEDAVALESIRPCFPDREVVGIDCRGIILQYGSLHCVTMQFPEGVLT